jgi:hypothetical protein
MMSRPQSPFKRSMKASSQSSPGRTSPTRNNRYPHHSEQMSPRGYFSGASSSHDNGAGPSKYAAVGPSSMPSSSTCLSRAEHYDVVLEGSSGEWMVAGYSAMRHSLLIVFKLVPSPRSIAAAVSSCLGGVVLDQFGNMDLEGVPMEGSFNLMSKSGSGSSINAIQVSGSRTKLQSNTNVWVIFTAL